MSEEEKKPEQAPEQTEMEEQSAAVTRRQFLIGAGAGLVVGAAGAAGVLVATRGNKSAAPTTAQTTSGQPSAPPAQQPAAQAATQLPATMRQVTLNINGQDHDMTIDVRMSLW